jgi:hypothetical protein
MTITMTRIGAFERLAGVRIAESYSEYPNYKHRVLSYCTRARPLSMIIFGGFIPAAAQDSEAVRITEPAYP